VPTALIATEIELGYSAGISWSDALALPLPELEWLARRAETRRHKQLESFVKLLGKITGAKTR
jgi:hypothetical protein